MSADTSWWDLYPNPEIYASFRASASEFRFSGTKTEAINTNPSPFVHKFDELRSVHWLGVVQFGVRALNGHHRWEVKTVKSLYRLVRLLVVAKALETRAAFLDGGRSTRAVSSGTNYLAFPSQFATATEQRQQRIEQLQLLSEDLAQQNSSPIQVHGSIQTVSCSILLNSA